MRLALLLLAALLVLGACAVGARQIVLGGGPDAPLTPPPEGALRLATHNVHYIVMHAETGRWSRGDWARRRPALGAAFEALDADVVAFQEMESWARGSQNAENLALDWLLERNPDYGAAAQGDAARTPSTQPIFYRRDRLEVLDEGWFFFSETPDVLYSRGFDGAPPSFASWARLGDLRGGTPITVVNVHFDWGSWENRRGAAELVAAFAKARIADGERVALLGDLNALAGSPTLGILEEAGLAFPDVPGATVHFDRGLNLFGAIDHVGLGPGLAPAGAPMVLRARWDGVWPSDHYPVALDVLR